MEWERLLSLRHLPRTGWVLRGVPASIAETVADHSFLTALVAIDVARRARERGFELELEKVLAMSILHDVAEAVTGDVVRYVKQLDEELFGKAEEEALRSLGLGAYSALLAELRRLESPEALVVKASDDLATIIEGSRLLRQGYAGVEEILDNVCRHVEELSARARREFGDSLADAVEAVLKDSGAYCPPRSQPRRGESLP
ncbi:HD domain-containing protein [Thermofilum pendens]|uniref:5'-deoxynucleotidase n=1 Tax=Thermofilum pendens (strain DSM 2475 / Hrk 5) TaxID=368408 RepID=A1RZE6_THEPD|nr:HD domain-containing protein [Thermofilum pendens]ABL78576.1 metal dependent phosphohydrolase [Thermofilum pendens Hrk 5]